MKLDFKDKAHAKVGSLGNAHHTPGGGRVTVSVIDIYFVYAQLFYCTLLACVGVPKKPVKNYSAFIPQSSGICFFI